jgi:hypothetical protein
MTFHSAKTPDSSSQQTASDAGIWAFVVVRKQRDRDSLSADYAAGETHAKRIVQGIGSWLFNWRSAVAAQAPICLVCERALRRPKSAPDTFCIATTDEPQIKRNVVVSGVCKRCAATRTDAELLTQAASEAVAGSGGEILGFGTIGAPPSNLH